MHVYITSQANLRAHVYLVCINYNLIILHDFFLLLVYYIICSSMYVYLFFIYINGGKNKILRIYEHICTLSKLLLFPEIINTSANL